MHTETSNHRLEAMNYIEFAATMAAPFRATEETELERLKHRLLQARLATVDSADLNARLRRAANEATSLAWATACPLLVFPELFSELAASAEKHAARQRGIRSRSAHWVAQTA